MKKMSCLILAAAMLSSALFAASPVSRERNVQELIQTGFNKAIVGLHDDNRFFILFPSMNGTVIDLPVKVTGKCHGLTSTVNSLDNRGIGDFVFMNQQGLWTCDMSGPAPMIRQLSADNEIQTICSGISLDNVNPVLYGADYSMIHEYSGDAWHPIARLPDNAGSGHGCFMAFDGRNRHILYSDSHSVWAYDLKRSQWDNGVSLKGIDNNEMSRMVLLNDGMTLCFYAPESNGGKVCFCNLANQKAWADEKEGGSDVKGIDAAGSFLQIIKRDGSKYRYSLKNNSWSFSEMLCSGMDMLSSVVCAEGDCLVSSSGVVTQSRGAAENEISVSIKTKTYYPTAKQDLDKSRIVYEVKLRGACVSGNDIFVEGCNVWEYTAAVYSGSNLVSSHKVYPILGAQCVTDANGECRLVPREITFDLVVPSKNAGDDPYTLKIEQTVTNPDYPQKKKVFQAETSIEQAQIQEDKKEYSKIARVLDDKNVMAFNGVCAIPVIIQIQNADGITVKPEAEPRYSQIVFKAKIDNTTIDDIVGCDITKMGIAVIPAESVEIVTAVKYGTSGNRAVVGKRFYIFIGPSLYGKKLDIYAGFPKSITDGTNSWTNITALSTTISYPYDLQSNLFELSLCGVDTSGYKNKIPVQFTNYIDGKYEARISATSASIWGNQVSGYIDYLLIDKADYRYEKMQTEGICFIFPVGISTQNIYSRMNPSNLEETFMIRNDSGENTLCSRTASVSPQYDHIVDIGQRDVSLYAIFFDNFGSTYSLNKKEYVSSKYMEQRNGNNESSSDGDMYVVAANYTGTPIILSGAIEKASHDVVDKWRGGISESGLLLPRNSKKLRFACGHSTLINRVKEETLLVVKTYDIGRNQLYENKLSMKPGKRKGGIFDASLNCAPGKGIGKYMPLNMIQAWRYNASALSVHLRNWGVFFVPKETVTDLNTLVIRGDPCDWPSCNYCPAQKDMKDGKTDQISNSIRNNWHIFGERVKAKIVQDGHTMQSREYTLNVGHNQKFHNHPKKEMGIFDPYISGDKY